MCSRIKSIPVGVWNEAGCDRGLLPLGLRAAITSAAAGAESAHVLAALACSSCGCGGGFDAGRLRCRLAGELAAAPGAVGGPAKGPGTVRVGLLDQLHAIGDPELVAGVRMEVME